MKYSNYFVRNEDIAIKFVYNSYPAKGQQLAQAHTQACGPDTLARQNLDRIPVNCPIFSHIIIDLVYGHNFTFNYDINGVSLFNRSV